MIHAKLARRILSMSVVVAMTTSILSTMVEAAVGTWLAPQPGQRIVSRNVEVSVGFNTQSALKVTRLELWIDGQYYAKKVLIRPDSRGVCSFNWDTSRAQRGAHDLLVKIFAGDEMISTVSGTGTVGEKSYDLRPPAVRFANIKTGDVLKGVRNIRLAASDDGDESPIISLLVDDTLKLLTNRKPYNYDLDTTKYPDGSHELQTFAYDSAGNKSDPAVVNVSFKNNAAKPIVAAMTVEPKSSVVAPSEDDGVGQVLAPVSVAPRTDSASRGADKPADTAVKSLSSGPVAKAPVRTQAPAQTALAGCSEAVTAKVTPVRARSEAVAARPAAKAVPAVPAVRANPTKPAGDVSAMVAALPTRASEPVEMAAARESTTKPIVAASRPSIRSVEAEMTVVSRNVVEPNVVDAPEASQSTTMASAAGVDVRTTARPSEVANMSPTVPVDEMAEPVTAAARSAEVGCAPGVRPIDPAMVAKAGPGSIGRPVALVDDPIAAPAKPVRMAMAPSLRMTSPDGARRCTIVCPPPARKETRAKIEKQTLPGKGKMKVRDLFEKMGGLVFWDADSHTVTAYGHDLKLELTIGSTTALVNGHKMTMRQAPRVVDGRTVFDVAVYHQACALAQSLAKTASAK